MGLLLLSVGIAGLLTSTIFIGMVFVASRRFHPPTGAQDAFTPPVSLLKPLHGAEPGLREYLETFFRLDYPNFEILFCARHEDDPGLQIAREVAARHSQVRTRFLTSGEPPWPNARCFSLSVMERAAAHDILVITDSDTRVDQSYLRDVVRPFQNRAVGVATCVYRGVPAEGGVWARLEALGMSVEMTSGVLVANMLEEMRFTLGPSMVVRKKCIHDIGGFAALGTYYADDFMLGNLAFARGYKVVLSEHVIDHCVVNLTMKKSLDHQLAWMRSARFSRPAGHAGTALVFSTPFGIMAFVGAALIGRPMLGLALFSFSYVSKIIQSAAVGSIIQDRAAVKWAWLYPVRDLMGFLFWVASYASKTVGWRDDTFVLQPDGSVRLLRQASR